MFQLLVISFAGFFKTFLRFSETVNVVFAKSVQKCKLSHNMQKIERVNIAKNMFGYLNRKKKEF